MIDQNASQNFTAAKVIAIFTVVTTHWIGDPRLWVFSTVGLFIFGFSSAFFTARIYGTEVDVKAFWKKKVQRLGIRYWLILGALAVLLTIQGKDVFHWHSLVHLTGLSGVLNLFGPSEGGLGRGLWFFTVLLLFYVLYPVVAGSLCSGKRTDIVLVLLTAGMLVLDSTVKPGFALWVTMLGFILGIYVGVNRVPLTAGWLKVWMLASFLGFGALNAMGYKVLNGALIFSLALALSLWLTVASGRKIPLLGVLTRLETCLLEIYLIHSYLFIRPTAISPVDFALSLVLIVAAAFALNFAGNRLVAWIFADRRPALPIDAEMSK